MPATAESEHLTAHVIDGSPGHQVGIRNGDRLVRLGTIDFAKWKETPETHRLHWILSGSPGTKIPITLVRAGKTLRLTATLEEIFPEASEFNPVGGGEK